MANGITRYVSLNDLIKNTFLNTFLPHIFIHYFKKNKGTVEQILFYRMHVAFSIEFHQSCLS